MAINSDFFTLDLPFGPPMGEAEELSEAMCAEVLHKNVGKAMAGTLTWEDVIAQAAMAVCTAHEPSEKRRLLEALRDVCNAAADSLERQMIDIDFAFGDKG